MKVIASIKYVNHLFKKDLQSYTTLRLASQAKDNPKSKETKPKRVIKVSKDVEQYLNSQQHLQKIKTLIPVRFLKKNRKSPDDLYLVDSVVAKDIAEAIKPHILQKNKTIIETNPGFGFITKELLESGLKNLQLYESTVCFRNHILNLDQQHPGKLKLYNRDFFSIWKLSYQDRHDNGDRIKKMLSNVELKQWNEEPAMTIIGSTASANFLRHLILSLIFQFGIMTYGRCELYLIMPPYLYIQLTANSGVGYLLYRASSVLFQIFCDHEILLKVPRKSFVPWDGMIDAKRKSKLWKFYNVDPDCMYLTRIEFKKDLGVPMDKLQPLWYFLQHMMLSRTGKLIPALEKWIPDCGIRLILANSSDCKEQPVFKDISIFTETGQLNPEQFLNLFKEFSSWPEYSESSFTASMEAAMLKMESIQAMDIQDPEENLEKETKNVPDEL